MKFFLGLSERELITRQGGSMAEHYAWCLSQLDEQLNAAKTTDEKRQVLFDFKNNMQNNNQTKILFNHMENQFYKILNDLPSDNEYIFNCLAGMPIDNDYLNYS